MSQDADNKLDSELIEYFSEMHLDPVKAEVILSETAHLRVTRDDGSMHSNKKGLRSGIGAWLRFNNNFRLQAVLTAATLCIAVTSIYIGVGVARQDKQMAAATNSQAPSVSGLSDLVLREAAMNHQTKLELDVKASDLEELQQGMKRLDFKVALPESVGSGYQLVGGRYCTIAGQLAAHIRFEDIPDKNQLGLFSDEIVSGAREGQSTSLFVTPYSPDLNLLSDMNSQFPDGIAVKSWKQGDLYYVLAAGQKS